MSHLMGTPSSLQGEIAALLSQVPREDMKSYQFLEDPDGPALLSDERRSLSPLGAAIAVAGASAAGGVLVPFITWIAARAF